MKIRYDSNNSGGGWSLTDEDWLALEAAGWSVHWVKDDKRAFGRGSSDRWLGALATSASVERPSIGEAVAEFERITGKAAGDEGCSCCGPPHYFEEVGAA